MVGEVYYLSQERSMEIPKEFYFHYDADYWTAKIHLYDYLINNISSLAKEIEALDEEEVEHYERLLKSEFVYMFYHSSEALLSLVRSLLNNGLPWIDMKNTYTSDLDDFIESQLGEEALVDDIEDVFYFGAEALAEENDELIEKSCDFISSYLSRVGGMFSSDRVPYNEYKHGLRLITSSGKVEIALEDTVEDSEESLESLKEIDGFDEESMTFTGMNGNLFTYLDEVELEDDDGNTIDTLARGMRPIEYDYYRRLCQVNNDLIGQIFSTRRTAYDIPVDNQAEIEVKLYHEVAIEDLFESKNMMKNFTFNYNPLGKDDVLVYEAK